MGAPYVYTRPIRFDEIDAAGYVFYANLTAIPHEALERLLHEVNPGGYAAFVVGQRVGLPCVHVQADFTAPLRFGDEMRVELSVVGFGATSIRFDVRLVRGDGTPCAKIDYVCACAQLDGPTKHPIPAEMRRALEPHLL